MHHDLEATNAPRGRAPSRMQRRFAREVAALGLCSGPITTDPVRERDVLSLPPAVQRYLRFMGAIGRPRVWSFRAGSIGQFRLRPDQRFVPCEVWQYDTSLDVARVFHLRVKLAGVLPTLGRDTYVGGRGRMLVRPLDLFTVLDASGREYEISELVTFLNDAILFAPSMLLGAWLGSRVVWSSADSGSFDVCLSAHGHEVTARVTLDDRGAPRDFTTTDRWVRDPFTRGHPLVRGRWTTPVEDFTRAQGRTIAARASAVWHLPGGTFEYARLSPIVDSVAYNVPPGG
jgi:hypothetical protein